MFTVLMDQICNVHSFVCPVHYIFYNNNIFLCVSLLAKTIKRYTHNKLYTSSINIIIHTNNLRNF